MIELAHEHVLSLSAAAKTLPPRRAGKRPHVSVLYRWATNGLRGHRLETVQVGGTKCTSIEALQRFFNRLGGEGNAVNVDPSSPADRPKTSRRQREAEIRRAEAALAADGVF